MYCVIQEIENKKCNENGAYKELEVISTTLAIDNEIKTKYSYMYTGDRFERLIRKAYKISIHSSYRDSGKVKKKQWVICTIGYYDIVEGWTWIGDHTVRLDNKLKKIGITEDELCNLVYKKLDPLIEKIKTEFQQTEEYKTSQEHKKILDKYNKAKEDFESKYGQNTYDYCYDVFGTLRNEKLFNNIKVQYEASQEHNRGYYENFKSNYGYNSYSSYQENLQSNYNDDDKKYLKSFYKILAMKFHPDKGGDSEAMKLINQLKKQWGI